MRNDITVADTETGKKVRVGPSGQRGTFRYTTVAMASIVRRIPKDIWDLAVDSARAHNWDKGDESEDEDC